MKKSNAVVKYQYILTTTAIRYLPAKLSLLCVPTAIVSTAYAEIVPNESRPNVSQEEHQAARIDIQAPNEQGVSHNVYESFDVDKKGAVLNNSRNGSDTELAGRITGNPNLSDQERGLSSMKSTAVIPATLTACWKWLANGLM